jgi:hypothetical protein
MLVRLLGEQAIPKVSSFQLTRSARLGLAHQEAQRRPQKAQEKGVPNRLCASCVPAPYSPLT